MSNPKPCPCGHQPTEVGWDIFGPWLIAFDAECDCNWHVEKEFLDGEDIVKAAEELWNNAPRGINNGNHPETTEA